MTRRQKPRPPDVKKPKPTRKARKRSRPDDTEKEQPPENGEGVEEDSGSQGEKGDMSVATDQAQEPVGEGDPEAPEGRQVPEGMAMTVDLDQLSRKSIAAQQLSDTQCQRIRAGLADMSDTERAKEMRARYRIADDGILTYAPDVNKPDDTRIVLPKSLVPLVMSVYHYLPLAGHMGRSKTYRAIERRWYWKGMWRDVRDMVGGCLRCQRRKRARPARAGWSQFRTASYPFEQIHVDIVGGFPEYGTGQNRIMTIVDAFTSYAIAVPISNESAATFVKVIYENVICVHGCPKRIITDRAQGFIAKVIKGLCERLDVKKIETSGYMPQANGKVERYHKVLGAALTIYAIDKRRWFEYLTIYAVDKRKWFEYVHAVVFAYNVSVHASTGYSPYQLVYGRDPRLPLDILLEDNDTEYVDEAQFGLTVSQTVRDTFKKVRQAQLDSLRASQEKRDEGRYSVDLQPGTWVLHWEPEKAQKGVKTPQKMLNRWSFPCKVIKKVGPGAYQIHSPWRKRPPHTFNAPVSKLIPFSPWDHSTIGWLEEVHQAKDEEVRVEVAETEEEPAGFPKVGDLAIVPLDDIREPFSVVKILSIKDGDYTVQWFGNLSQNMQGRWSPGWLHPKDRRAYYARHPRGNSKRADNIYTNKSKGVETRLTHDSFAFFGFELDPSSDRLPAHVLRRISESNQIDYVLPTTDNPDKVDKTLAHD
jgi:transposase InsO family protein